MTTINNAVSGSTSSNQEDKFHKFAIRTADGKAIGSISLYKNQVKDVTAQLAQQLVAGLVVVEWADKPESTVVPTVAELLAG